MHVDQYFVRPWLRLVNNKILFYNIFSNLTQSRKTQARLAHQNIRIYLITILTRMFQNIGTKQTHNFMQMYVAF